MTAAGEESRRRKTQETKEMKESRRRGSKCAGSRWEPAQNILDRSTYKQQRKIYSRERVFAFAYQTLAFDRAMLAVMWKACTCSAQLATDNMSVIYTL
jgi:hypothetical protein